MLVDFASWLSDLSITETADHAEKREAAVHAYLEDATKKSLELLARVAFNVKVNMESPEVAELRTKLTGQANPPGDVELVRLAAAALMAAMQDDEDDETAAIAATVVATTACGGLRKPKLPVDLVGIGANILLQLSDTSRRRPSLEFAKPPLAALVPAEVNAAAEKAGQGDHVGALNALVASTNKVLGSLKNRQVASEAAFRLYVKMQDEELDILWWLLGSHCDSLSQNFDEVPAVQRPLAFANELSRLTISLPGPTAIQSLLARAGVTAKKTPKQKLTAAVESMSAAWRSSILSVVGGGDISASSTPILFAIQRCQEIDGAAGWATPWAALTGLSETAELEPLKLAEAAYRELILAQLV